jgi:hypothetical protein
VENCADAVTVETFAAQESAGAISGSGKLIRIKAVLI